MAFFVPVFNSVVVGMVVLNPRVDSRCWLAMDLWTNLNTNIGYRYICDIVTAL